MADQVLGFGPGGETIYRRDDGTFYQRDAFGISQTECIGPGQDPATALRYPSYSLDAAFLNSTPLPCSIQVQTSDPRAGEAYFGGVLSPLLDVLGPADPGLGPLPGASPTAETLIAIANAPLRGAVSYEELLAGTAPPGSIGLIPLLQATEAAGANDALAAQIELETTAFRDAVRPLALAAIEKQRDSQSLSAADQVSAFANVLTNPAGFAVSLASNVALGLLAPQPNERLQVDQVGAFFNYEDAIARSQSPEFRAFVDAYRRQQMGLLDSLGITGFNGGALALRPDIFDLPTDPVGGGGLPPITSTSGGILDSIFSGLGSVLSSAAANPGAVISIIDALSARGIIRGSVGAAFNANNMQTASVSPSSVKMYGMGGGMAGNDLLSALALALGDSSTSQGDGTMIGNAMAGLENLFGVNQSSCNNGPLRVPFAMAMALQRMGCGGRSYIPRRILVDDAKGVPHVLYNAGPATIGSREHAVARSIAKRHGLVLRARGSGGGRRTYRRRRPR